MKLSTEDTIVHIHRLTIGPLKALPENILLRHNVLCDTCPHSRALLSLILKHSSIKRLARFLTAYEHAQPLSIVIGNGTMGLAQLCIILR